MVRHAIAIYVGEQLTCLQPYQINEQVYIIFIAYMHFNTLNILYVSFTFHVLLLYTCLSENSSDELMLWNSHVNQRQIKLLVSCIIQWRLDRCNTSWWYPDQRSILLNTVAPLNAVMSSSRWTWHASFGEWPCLLPSCPHTVISSGFFGLVCVTILDTHSVGPDDFSIISATSSFAISFSTFSSWEERATIVC